MADKGDELRNDHLGIADTVRAKMSQSVIEAPMDEHRLTGFDNKEMGKGDEVQFNSINSVYQWAQRETQELANLEEPFKYYKKLSVRIEGLANKSGFKKQVEEMELEQQEKSANQKALTLNRSQSFDIANNDLVGIQMMGGKPGKMDDIGDNNSMTDLSAPTTPINNNLRRSGTQVQPIREDAKLNQL